MKAILVFVGLLLTSGSALPQSGVADLRATYGEPIREVYMARPTVEVAVNYGTDHQVCKIAIQSTVVDWNESTKELLEQVLEEVVPSSTRGSAQPALELMTGCGGSSSTEYREMFVSRVTNHCHPPAAVTSPPTTEVLFKSKDCARFTHLSNAKGQ